MAQGEFTDTPVEREDRELGMGRVRRKDFQFPAAQVLNQSGQIEPDFHVL
jgi:hypothetical protein